MFQGKAPGKRRAENLTNILPAEIQISYPPFGNVPVSSNMVVENGRFTEFCVQEMEASRRFANKKSNPASTIEFNKPVGCGIIMICPDAEINGINVFFDLG